MDYMKELIELDKLKRNSAERKEILNAEYSDEYCEEAETFEIEIEGVEFGE